MVAQNAENQRRKLDSIEISGRPSFSHRDLDYKMKMLQLTLVYRHSVVENQLPAIDHPHRHSISQETFAKVKPFAIGQPFHRPKILAVEPKLKSESDKKHSRPLPNMTSATLPSNSQHSKVQRLVQMFETSTNTPPKRPAQSLSRPSTQQAKVEPKVQPPSPPKSNATVDRKDESIPNDDEIRAELKQRKKLEST